MRLQDPRINPALAPAEVPAWTDVPVGAGVVRQTPLKVGKKTALWSLVAACAVMAGVFAVPLQTSAQNPAAQGAQSSPLQSTQQTQAPSQQSPQQTLPAAASANSQTPPAVNPAAGGANPSAGNPAAANQAANNASAGTKADSKPAVKPATTQIAPGPAFSSLTPYQADVLKPLQSVWDELGDVRKRKWIEIANRLPTLTDDEKNRVLQRMQEWAALSSEQRKVVRDNFSEAMNRPSAERQSQWEEYQKLSPEARQALAERARQELKQKRDASSPSGPVGAAATTRPSGK